MHLNESFGSHPGLTYICNLHEQACAVAADAYGQYSGNLGVVHVTTGPGGTNALTGVAAAYLDSTPLLVISGQVKRADIKGSRAVRQIGFQEIDIVSMARPVTKYAETITDPSTIRYHLEKAAWLARHGRPGPVWIDIPLDVQATVVEPEDLPGYSPEPEPGQDFIEKAKATIALLRKSERPVILAGNGIRLSGAIDRFHQLIELLGAPVLLTWKAIDFLGDDHPLYCGRPGGTGQRGANFTQQNADLLLILGARLDAGQTAYSHKNFARGAQKVMVDIDPGEIEKMQTPIAVPVPGDAGTFLDALLIELENCAIPDYASWLEKSRAWCSRYPVCLPEYWNRTEKVDNYVLVDVLSDLMSPEDLLVPGSSGQSSEITMQAFRPKRGQRILNSQGLGPMGFGIPAALGACLASGGRRTISIDGDGGFIMNIQELETLRRLSLPVKIFILNNEGYGSIRSSQRNYFKGHYVASDPASGVTLPSWQAVAQSYGLPFLRIANHDELQSVAAQALEHPGPVVCEVIIPTDQPSLPRVTSRQRVDGSLVSSPMEDMAPFLDREEFLSNLLIPPASD